jgi:hypothetical protein
LNYFSNLPKEHLKIPLLFFFLSFKHHPEKNFPKTTSKEKRKKIKTKIPTKIVSQKL